MWCSSCRAAKRTDCLIIFFSSTAKVNCLDSCESSLQGTLLYLIGLSLDLAHERKCEEVSSRDHFASPKTRARSSSLVFPQCLSQTSTRVPRRQCEFSPAVVCTFGRFALLEYSSCSVYQHQIGPPQESKSSCLSQKVTLPSKDQTCGGFIQVLMFNLHRCCQPLMGLQGKCLYLVKEKVVIIRVTLF